MAGRLRGKSEIQKSDNFRLRELAYAMANTRRSVISKYKKNMFVEINI